MMRHHAQPARPLDCSRKLDCANPTQHCELERQPAADEVGETCAQGDYCDRRSFRRGLVDLTVDTGGAPMPNYLVAACGSGGGGNNQSATPKHGGTATIALESELRTLDPLDSSLLVEREVFYNMY